MEEIQKKEINQDKDYDENFHKPIKHRKSNIKEKYNDLEETLSEENIYEIR
jgi:hypothetical protein